MIFAYHSLGPDSKITLDSLVPEALGSTNFDLIPNGNKEAFAVSSLINIGHNKCHSLIQCSK